MFLKRLANPGRDLLNRLQSLPKSKGADELPIPGSAVDQIEHLKQDLASRVRQVTAINTQLIQNQEAMRDQSEYIHSLETHIHALNETLFWCQSQLDMLVRHNDVLGNELVQRDMTLAHLSEQNQGLNAQFYFNQASFVTETQQLISQLGQYDTNNHMLQTQVESLKSMVSNIIEQTTRILSQNNEQIQHLTIENSKLQQQLNAPRALPPLPMPNPSELQVSISKVSELGRSMNAQRVTAHSLPEIIGHIKKEASWLSSADYIGFCRCLITLFCKRVSDDPDRYFGDATQIPLIQKVTLEASESGQKLRPYRIAERTSIFHLAIQCDHNYIFLKALSRFFPNMMQVVDSDGVSVWQSLLYDLCAHPTKFTELVSWIDYYVGSACRSDALLMLRYYLSTPPVDYIFLDQPTLIEASQQNRDTEQDKRVKIEDAAIRIFESCMVDLSHSNNLCRRILADPEWVTDTLNQLAVSGRGNQESVLVLLGRVWKYIENLHIKRDTSIDSRRFEEKFATTKILALVRHSRFSNIRRDRFLSLTDARKGQMGRGEGAPRTDPNARLQEWQSRLDERRNRDLEEPPRPTRAHEYFSSQKERQFAHEAEKFANQDDTRNRDRQSRDRRRDNRDDDRHRESNDHNLNRDRSRSPRPRDRR